MVEVTHCYDQEVEERGLIMDMVVCYVDTVDWEKEEG